MITGFNTDIDFAGKVYHVQTEDKGLRNPVIETLVYTGGQIVCARKTSYADLVAAGEAAETQIHHRMETQHRELIREIRDGTLTEEDLEPFGGKFISNKSFDEVVWDFLAESVPVEKIRLDLIEPEDLRAGEEPTVKIVVIDDTSERPIPGASVVVKLVNKTDSVIELLSARTDDEGLVESPCPIPAKPGAGPALLLQAEAAGHTAEMRCRVRRGARASARRS